MKKIILFCLSVCLLGMLLLGCPNGEETTTTTLDYSKCTQAPGTIESAPSILLDAMKNITVAENEAVFVLYRTEELYSDYTLYIWIDGESGIELSDAAYTEITVDGKKLGYMKFNSSGSSDNGCTALPGTFNTVIANGKTLNFIVKKKGTWDGQTANLKWDLSVSKSFGAISSNYIIYALDENAKPLIREAILLNDDTVVLSLSNQFAIEPVSGKNNGFIIKSSSGNQINITDMYDYSLSSKSDITFDLRCKNNFSNKFIVKTEKITNIEDDYFISNSKFLPETGLKLVKSTLMKSSISTMEYANTDLGLTINGNNISFKVFAPLASHVNVLLYKTWEAAAEDIDNASYEQTLEDELTNGERKQMNKVSDFDTTGIWSSSDIALNDWKYYVFEIDNFGIVYRVCDINALVAAPDSIAAQIISIDNDACKPTGWETSYTNPFGNNGTETKTYCDAVIYEMHIRDWSRAFKENSTGKFDDITEALGTNGDGPLGEHLRDLGITHVQILPMFDYAQKNSDLNYNWGYNPYHYNVPEGRYTNNHDDGGQEAVKQMRGMIKAFHDAGIAVNMDVVYNHTDGTGIGSLYDMTVPYYYYRLSNGMYSNGSGCGNETDSSMPMFRKYMIDSLSHWMKDYHINGFRFDLMGLHETETMKAVYEALSRIDKNVMVYGEPWTGGDSPVKNGLSNKGRIEKCIGVGCFNDTYRNAIKGAEFGGFALGHVQGKFADSGIATGLKGSVSFTKDNPGRSLNYAECHDNYTLFDKLVYSTLSSLTGDLAPQFQSAYNAVMSDENKLNLIRSEMKLAGAFVLLAHGTPFINGGQEFMRTKKGDPDSYAADSKGGIRWTNEAGQYNIDSVNTIDLSFKDADKYQDVYNVYKGLIKLRRTYDAFTNSTAPTTEKPFTGVTKYEVTGSNGNLCVYFNATQDAQTINTSGYTVAIDITGGTLVESDDLPTSVPALSFVVLKK